MDEASADELSWEQKYFALYDQVVASHREATKVLISPDARAASAIHPNGFYSRRAEFQCWLHSKNLPPLFSMTIWEARYYFLEFALCFNSAALPTEFYPVAKAGGSSSSLLFGEHYRAHSASSMLERVEKGSFPWCPLSSGVVAKTTWIASMDNAPVAQKCLFWAMYSGAECHSAWGLKEPEEKENEVRRRLLDEVSFGTHKEKWTDLKRR